jgi:hypothetical protein
VLLKITPVPYNINKIMGVAKNGGFCNVCITKRILLILAFHSQENQYYADYADFVAAPYNKLNG